MCSKYEGFGRERRRKRTCENQIRRASKVGKAQKDSIPIWGMTEPFVDHRLGCTTSKKLKLVMRIHQTIQEKELENVTQKESGC
jgi:hypothetical protein